MRDSSKSTKEDPYGFNSMDLVIKMCIQHQIEISQAGMFHFPKGWKVLVLDFLNKLKQYPVVLIEVIDTYGQLDIKFEMKSENDELHVWRLVDYFRLESRHTCTECGLLSYLVSVTETHMKICKDCSKVSSEKLTGTWLDKYV